MAKAKAPNTTIAPTPPAIPAIKPVLEEEEESGILVLLGVAERVVLGPIAEGTRDEIPNVLVGTIAAGVVVGLVSTLDVAIGLAAEEAGFKVTGAAVVESGLGTAVVVGSGAGSWVVVGFCTAGGFSVAFAGGSVVVVGLFAKGSVGLGSTFGDSSAAAGAFSLVVLLAVSSTAAAAAAEGAALAATASDLLVNSVVGIFYYFNGAKSEMMRNGLRNECMSNTKTGKDSERNQTKIAL
jgi:hypothetical protein